MLKYTVEGPFSDSMFRVVYLTPGCAAKTAAGTCFTEEQAQIEADRLNAQQRHQQEHLNTERSLCGLHRQGDSIA